MVDSVRIVGLRRCPALALGVHVPGKCMAGVRCVQVRPLNSLPPPSNVLCFTQVSNALIKNELGVRLQFPTYREGLSAIAQGDMRPYN